MNLIFAGVLVMHPPCPTVNVDQYGYLAGLVASLMVNIFLCGLIVTARYTTNQCELFFLLF
jgi:hypothetical protein